MSQISKLFNISTRTLRYYEQIGLIQPVKKNDYAYRTYDENTVMRLQQIIVLRKLRIPLKQIADILKSEDEITALSTIKNVIQILLERLHMQKYELWVSIPDDLDRCLEEQLNYWGNVQMCRSL